MAELPRDVVARLASSGRRIPDESQAVLCRRSIYSFISDYLDNLTAESDWLLFYDFATEIWKCCPETFVVTAHHPPSTLTRDHAFVLWLFSCLLKVLSQVEGSSLYPRTTECLRNILTLSKSKDHPLFYWLLQEMIQLTADLGGLSRVYSSGGLQFPVFLSHFEFPWKHDEEEGGDGGVDKGREQASSELVLDSLLPPLIEIRQYSHLVSLQLATLEMLQHFAPEICHLCPTRVQLLFEAVSLSLQCGGLNMKQHALEMASDLLCSGAVASGPTVDHLTWCLLAVLSLVTTRHSANEGTSVELETSLARCLRVMFFPNDGEPLVIRRFWNPLFTALGECLRTAYHKCSDCMKECIGELVSRCYSLNEDRAHVTAEAIFCNIGRSVNLQPLVGALCHIVGREKAKLKDVSAAQDYGSGVQHSDEGPSQAKKAKIELGRKKLSRQMKGERDSRGAISPSKLRVASVLSLNAVQCGKLAVALCSEQGVLQREAWMDKLLCYLEGIRMVLEVWVRVTVVPKGSHHYPDPWLSSEELSGLCRAWEAAVAVVTAALQESGDGKQEGLEKVDKLLACVIDSAGITAAHAGSLSLSSVVIDRSLWMIGLPWAQARHHGGIFEEGLVAGTSLTKQQCQNVKEVVALNQQTCTLSKCSSVWAFAALPVDSASHQKKDVLQDALRDPCHEVQRVAVKVLAVALASLRKEDRSPVVSTFRAFRTEDVSVQLVLAKELPQILLSAALEGQQVRFSTKKKCSIPVLQTCRVAASLTEGKTSSGVKLDTDLLGVGLEVVSMVTSTEVIAALVESFATIVKHSDDPTPVHNHCLDFFAHESHQVRSAICEHVQLFFPSPFPEDGLTDPDNHPVIKKLKKTFLIGKKQGSSHLQETAVTAFGQIGRFARGGLLVSSLGMLLNFILEPSATIRATAHAQVHRVSKAHGLTCAKLLSQFKEPVCEFLVELVHDPKSNMVEDWRSKFNQVALAFEMKDLKQLLESVKDLFVPMLVCRATPSASKALKFMAKITSDNNPRSLLVECSKHVFLYLVRSCRQKDYPIASNFLKAETGFEMQPLLIMDTKNVVNLLVLYLSSHRERVLNGMQILAKMNPASEKPEHLDEELIAEYLEPHLHGVVAFLNFMLVRMEYFENTNKGKLAIGSLIELMRLMGPRRITHVKMKLLAILRLCLTFKDDEVTKLTLSAWNCFVRSVELDSLGPLLGQIVVGLSPLVDTHSKTVSEIFNFLIVEHRAVLAPYFNEIYHMPEDPVLADVNAVLKEHSKEPRSFRQQLQHLLKGVTHERSDVRLHALKALHKQLKDNQVELESFMVGSDTVDPIITEIITTLLKGLRMSGAELRQEYGRCLGELGAIDAGKLDLPSVSPSKAVKFYEIDGDFAVDLLAELARAYLAATDTRSQDCCAFAIQEVLRLFDCANPDPGSGGAKLWGKVSADCQEVLRPHLNTSYTSSVPKAGKTSIPIFKQAKHFCFPEWISKWCTFLIDKLEDSLPKSVFRPCTIVFQHDISPALYLLPYVLTCALRQHTPALMRDIKTEVMAVLNYSAGSKDISFELADSSTMCAQTVFTCLDHLTAWANGKRKAAASRKGKGQQQKGVSDEVQRVIEFMDSIPKDLLAMSAFRCQAYTRALMYLECYHMGKPEALQKNLGFLQRIYVALDEPDGVAGVAAVRTAAASLEEQTLQYESTGSYRDAAACYERSIQLEPNELTHHEGLLRSMMRQGEFTSALMHVNGLQTEKPDWVRNLNAFRVEAAWKLGQWGDLEHHLKSESVSSKNWDVNLGRLLLAAKQRNVTGFLARLSKVRGEQMVPLSTASLEQGSYQRGYEYIVRLHMLQELEGVGGVLIPRQHGEAGSEQILERWHSRLQLTQESFKTQEPILSLRRVVLGLESSKFGKQIGHYWLESAKIARRAGHLQTAHSFLLNASGYSLPELCMERAEWMKNQGVSHDALLSLQKSVADQWPAVSTDSGGTPSRNTTHAEALLLIARWMEDTAHYDTQTVLRQYKSVISIHPESVDGHFYLGKYYDRLKFVFASDRPTKSAEFLHYIIRHYGQSLEHGSKYLYQSMPRLLTLWLDFGSNVPDTGDERLSGKKSQDKVQLKQTLSHLNELMRSFMQRLPPYQFLTAFSQLISRICHPNSEVFAQLEAIILMLIERYPQQSLWMMMAVSKSTHPDRQTRCKRILDKARKLSSIGRLVDDMVKLSDRLLEVCNKVVEPLKNHSMDKLCRGMARLTNSSDFSSIMVPLQASMTVTLPAVHGSSALAAYNPFPGVQPIILKFEDKVEVLASLQRPKKVTVLASDGHSYILMCKPKDDLRKDARLMEFNSVVNKCLRKDQSSRQRRLHIRTYAVIPLNEECGILEWVPNTHGLRNILHMLYQEKGIYVSGRELRDTIKAAQSDPSKLKEVFQNQLLRKHPPVFGEWFLRNFPDPTAWYSSRLSYARTSAVMSMVGYILGLGDRHGENVLFDSTTGDCVHVDFNCLFNRGETFDVPEVVPFRLTHNMVHGMGVTGYEGVFRKSCEVTMKVMRQECDALMCVLKTFIHDPLVEWGKVKGKASSADATNEKAMKTVKDIEDRLVGKYPKTKGLPLSIEGQVHALIKEATGLDNLSRMYIGWAAFL